MNMRGHGTATRPDYGYTIRLIRDIEAVLETFAIDRVHLAGLSRSESLITHFAAQFPTKVVEHDPFTGVAAGLAIADYYGISAPKEGA
jgi:pimeloyl-ACP methyl ester carboxylesterase